MGKTFQLKGSSITATVLKLYSNNLNHLEHQLMSTIKQAPRFFHQAPVLLDTGELKEPLDLEGAMAAVRKHGLIPIGLRGGERKLQHRAREAGLAVFNEQHMAQETASLSDQASSPALSKIIDQPVRSGQQIYAPGDLVVTASVSPGAELLAEGHIHIYGPLKGRALAGISGNADARIFCQALKAELVAIAGIYQVNEELAIPDAQHGLQIKLADQKILIHPY